MTVQAALSTAAPTARSAATGTAISQDGTKIGYYQMGQGPGVVLVQGTMGTAYHFMELAQALADTFTVYVPDRRGRGLSAGDIAEYSPQKEVEDLEALLNKTNANYVFGLSTGAIITLNAALSLPSIQRGAIFEPPIFIDGLPMALMTRFENEMAVGKIEAAMVSAMLASQMGPAVFNYVPRWLLERLVGMGMAQEDKKGSGPYPSMRTLASTLAYDFKVVGEVGRSVEHFRAIKTKVLLLGGGKSPAYLKNALGALAKVLPEAERIELQGVGHGAPWNKDRRGQPEIVADALRGFFG